MCPHVCGEQVVPAFAADLVQRTVVVTNSLQLRDLCHERGINMRKLALVRACFKRDSRLSSLLLTDMIARFSKVALRNMMRRAIFAGEAGAPSTARGPGIAAAGYVVPLCACVCCARCWC